MTSTSEHVREIRSNLREKDKEEAKALGLDVNKATFFAFKHACYKKTALVDGHVAAMWGLHGELLGSVGYPYLVTTPWCETISPLRFARIYRQEVEIMRQFFPLLENYVDPRYKEAVRLLKMAGFQMFPEVFNNTCFLRFRLES